MHHRDFQLEVAQSLMGCLLPADFGKKATSSIEVVDIRAGDCLGCEGGPLPTNAHHMHPQHA